MSENGPDPSQPASPDPSPAPLDSRTQQALARIRNALSRRKGDEAVRFFEDASTHGLIPGHENLLPWLRHALGPEPTEKLLSAFATLPCFYCNKGLIECEGCEGRGHDVDRTLCTECLSFGVSRCDFCGGSGWFTINHVPRAFQLPVILRRVIAAGKDAEALLGGPLPSVSAASASDARKSVARTLLQVNRVFGVLENMALASRQLESREEDSADTVRKVLAACDALAPRLKGRVDQLLQTLAAATRAEAASGTSSAARRTAQLRTEFYERLAATGNFTGTLLGHPLLFQEEPTAVASPVPNEEPDVVNHNDPTDSTDP